MLVVGLVGAASAQAQPVQVDTVRAELIADVASVAPGQTFNVGLHLIHDEGWHTYWRNPGDSGLPTQFPLTLPTGVSSSEIQWPLPTRLLIPPLANLGFEGEVLLMREVTVPADYSANTLPIETFAQWLVCREVCIPGETPLSLTLNVGAAAGPAANEQLFTTAHSRLAGQNNRVAGRMSDGRLSLVLPDELVDVPADGPAPRLEYFAYQNGLVSHAAPQRLGRLEPATGAGNGQPAWQLDLQLQPPLPPLNPGDPIEVLTLADATGVIVINEQRAIEVSPEARPDVFGGLLTAVSTIEGHIVPIFEQMNAANSLLAATGGGAAPSGGSLLDALGVGGGSSSGAASTVGGGSNEPPSASPSTGLETGQLAPAAAPGAQGGGSLQSVWLALVFAAVGGLILNLMPCVFPVIGLKILGFAGSGVGGSDLTPAARKQVRQGSLWFAAGVVLSFLVLAAVLLGLRSAGESIGWGFQLQSPLFVVLMALLFVAIGLNFSGVYEFGSSLTRLGNLQSGAADKSSHGAASAMGSGVLAVLVATPCTAPFMGSALGFTLTQDTGTTLLIFAALGIGMAAPYLALGFAPGWLKWLPKPGRWMETLRQFMAFPMYAAAAWLAWVLGLQVGVDAVLALAIAAVLLALALWMWGRLYQQGQARSRSAFAAVAVAITVGAVALAWPPAPSGTGSTQASAAHGSVNAQVASGAAGSNVPSELSWVDWQPGAAAQTLAQGQPVFIDFTAAWCVSCQVNKKLVLQNDSVSEAFEKAGVVLMRADWTNRDPAITAELARHGRNSVPLYLLYFPGGQAPVVLPELLTTSIVLDALSMGPVAVR
ncbi:MAG: protein-disulfide reductase DsbD family protein [Burkholderiaceae bacterium]